MNSSSSSDEDHPTTSTLPPWDERPWNKDLPVTFERWVEVHGHASSFSSCSSSSDSELELGFVRCEQCKKKLMKGSLTKHKHYSCAFGPKATNFECPLCQYKSAMKVNLDKHLQRVHDVHDSPERIESSESELSSSSSSDSDDDVLNQKIKKLKCRIFAPGAPKPPLKAYMRFTNERRKELKRDPTWLQLSKIHREKFIYDKWHQLSKECKVPYIEAAAKGRAIYKKKLRRFLRQNPNILEEELAKLKKKQTKRKAVSSSSSTDDDDPHDLVPLSKVIRLDDPHRANASSAAFKNKEPVASTSKSLSTESVPLPLNTRRTGGPRPG